MVRTKAPQRKVSSGKAPRASVTKKSKKEKKSRKSGGEGGKKRRWRPGVVAVREIRRLRKSGKLLLQKAPFQREVRSTVEKYKEDVWFKPSAMDALQEATESYLVGVFEGAVILQLHREKKTLTWKDLNYTRRIRGELDG
eukprot:TRINITY_DN37261_c0_g1_i11.p1 TRINITY_DN37261_c0_g1~~TRINITY_DN37261_c0_g1_i11.p1  ORF type:complete len:140 (+),score=54.43 TRINITY_DN37261_c0_g1_i11:71-490(+)